MNKKLSVQPLNPNFQFRFVLIMSGLSLDLSDREKFGSIQGEVLDLILDFTFELTPSTQHKGEGNQIRDSFSSKLPPRQRPECNEKMHIEI